MTGGIFALVGVLLGGVVAASWNFMLKTFEHRLQRRVAARSLLDALAMSAAAAEVASNAESARLLVPRVFEDLVQTWRDHRTSMATIPRAEWEQVETVCGQAAFLAASGGTAQEDFWTDASQRTCENFLRDAAAATAAIEPYAADSRRRLGRWLARP